jgi:hypothetical protein
MNAPEYKLFTSPIAPPAEVKKQSPEPKHPTTPIGVYPSDLGKSSPSPFSLKSSSYDEEEEEVFDFHFDETRIASGITSVLADEDS